VDVRIIATSSVPLQERMREKRFREDLYYRLAVVRIEMPPLRRRAGDIVAIAEGLIARVAARTVVERRALAPEAAARLAAHAWPGNLRELENAIERVLVLGGKGSGPIEAQEFSFLDEAVAGVPERLAREALSHGISLERFESALLDLAVRETRGNVTAAAKLVGLTRRAFDLRLERRRGGEAASGGTKADET
jgi:DNA-binding NtrC family response regulator